ncbi:MAG: hypothetical protein U1F77_08520 [Kiritimatiellia bacterium]
MDGTPTSVLLYPAEDYFENSYFKFTNPPPRTVPLLLLLRVEFPYAPGAGRTGVYVTHTDLDSNPNSVPNQQRQNDHYTWEIIEPTACTDAGRHQRGGDRGDPFPGTGAKYIFTEDTIPPCAGGTSRKPGSASSTSCCRPSRATPPAP